MNLDVIYNGKFMYALNHNLIIKNKVTEEKIEKIKKLHIQKLEVFNLMENEDSREILKSYANVIETIEYELQSLWGFPKDKNMHDWFNVPKCKCLKKDNNDRKGTPIRIFAPFCPIHGVD